MYARQSISSFLTYYRLTVYSFPVYFKMMNIYDHIGCSLFLSFVIPVTNFVASQSVKERRNPFRSIFRVAIEGERRLDV